MHSRAAVASAEAEASEMVEKAQQRRLESMKVAEESRTVLSKAGLALKRLGRCACSVDAGGPARARPRGGPSLALQPLGHGRAARKRRRGGPARTGDCSSTGSAQKDGRLRRR